MKNDEIWGTLPKIWDKPKIWENLKAKSLKAFCDKYKSKCGENIHVRFQTAGLDDKHSSV